MELLGCIAEVVPASGAGYVMAAVNWACVVLSRCGSVIFEIDNNKEAAVVEMNGRKERER